MDYWLLSRELRQQRRSIGRTALRATRRTMAVSARVDQLEQRLDRLSLVTQALWELVKRDRQLSDDDLARLVREVDLSDGVLDGKTPETVCVCATCEQIMSPDHETCLYCGADRLDRTPFEGL